MSAGSGPAPGSPGGFTPLREFLGTERGVACTLLLLSLLFNAFLLWPEVGVSTFSFNDEVVHLTAAREASSVLRQGMNPTDFWLSPLELGLPLFHYYQNLPHLVLAVTDQVTGFLIPLANLLDISRYLLLVLFPLSIFISMRRFGFDYLAAGFSAAIASLVSTYGLYGFNYGSYLWWGFGLYTQLWVMFFLPLALAEIYRSLRGEGSLFWPVFLSAIVLLCHLIYGVMLVVSAALFIFLTPGKTEILARLKRGAILLLCTGLAACYFYLPILLDSTYLYRTIWLSPFKYNSFGAFEVLKNLFTGNLLDYGRIPVLTILFFVAFVFVLREWRRENCRLLLVLTVVWLLVYFGRPAWGGLLDLLPFSENLLFHRFIGGFHLGAILLTGAGLSLCWQWLKGYSVKGFSLKSPLAMGLVFLLVLTPAFLGQALLYQENAHWRTENQKAFLAEKNEIAAIEGTLHNLSPGRVYAGIPTDFGSAPYYTIGSVPLYHLLPQLGFDTFGFAYTGFGLTTDSRLEFRNTKQEQYNVFNIRYVLLHKTWTPAFYYTRIRDFDTYVLYEVPTTGYFDLVDAPAIFYGNTSSFYAPNSKWLASSLPSLKEHPLIVLGDRPANTSGLPAFSFGEVNGEVLAGLAREQPSAGTILGETVGTGSYGARFVANRTCYLILKTNYHPGWEATLDGRRVSPVILTPGYIGIPVTPGTHEVLFTYHAPSYRFPLMLLGFLVLGILGYLEWKTSRDGYRRRGKEMLACLRQAWQAITRAVRGVLERMDPRLKDLLSLAVIWKLSLFLVLVLAWLYLPFNHPLYNSNHILPESADFFTIFKTWDAQHYLFLAENGYPLHLTLSAAYYPLYPVLLRVAGVFFLGNTLLAGLVFSNICSLLALVYFYLFVKKWYTGATAFLASLCMLSFITFFYTSLVYTEGLFLLLVMAFFYYLYEGQFWPSLCAAVLLPLTRPTGILVILPLLAYLAVDIWRSKQVRRDRKFLLPLGFIAGLLLYLAAMQYLTGSFLSGFEAQNLSIAGNSIANIFDPLSWIQRNFIALQFTINGYTTGIIDRIFFCIFLVLLYFIYRYTDTTLFVYSLALGVIPALTGNMMSYMRYMSVVFPVFIVLGLKFQKHPWALIIPLSVIQTLFFIAHGLNYWVS